LALLQEFGEATFSEHLSQYLLRAPDAAGPMYCDQRVCLSVCLSARLSRNRNLQTPDIDGSVVFASLFLHSAPWSVHILYDEPSFLKIAFSIGNLDPI